MKRVDLTKIKTYSLKNRKSKVAFGDFATIYNKGNKFRRFYKSWPNILKARDFRQLVESIVQAKKKSKPIIFMLGAHVIKCGLSPIIIDLINKRIISAIALNGAGLIHDFELAFIGRTSEDVDKAIQDGSFGMAKETAEFINNAFKSEAGADLGLGYAVAKAISKDKRLRFKNLSIIHAAYRRNIPMTVHVAIGTDIVHQHPCCDGRALGEASLRDFHNLINEISKIGNGGVVVNFGSTVVLPEVFLKALTVARNLGFKVTNFTTANFDMIYHYRPQENIVRRPIQNKGKGYYIIGHHEIMLPLLAAAIIEEL
jgi:deoxyhypusine synthase